MILIVKCYLLLLKLSNNCDLIPCYYSLRQSVLSSVKTILSQVTGTAAHQFNNVFEVRFMKIYSTRQSLTQIYLNCVLHPGVAISRQYATSHGSSEQSSVVKYSSIPFLVPLKHPPCFPQTWSWCLLQSDGGGDGVDSTLVAKWRHRDKPWSCW